MARKYRHQAKITLLSKEGLSLYLFRPSFYLFDTNLIKFLDPHDNGFQNPVICHSIAGSQYLAGLLDPIIRIPLLL